MAKKQKGTSALDGLNAADKQHDKNVEQYAKMVEVLYKNAVDELTLLASRINSLQGDSSFSFDANPKVAKEAAEVIQRLCSRIQAVVMRGNHAEWLGACTKTQKFIEKILNTSKLPKKKLQSYYDRNLEALAQFQERKVNGLGLSERVWKYVSPLKDEVELAVDVTKYINSNESMSKIDSAIGEGMSAAALSREVRSCLKEPNKLFRRVRDKYGNLHLSKAAKLYHPGQGVYRSSYKNAMRMTRSEINMAYRQSDHMRWQQMDFVVGFDVSLSNNHTKEDSKGHRVPTVDLCDQLAGRYPKEFKFVGWHPQCKCFATPILKTLEEVDKDVDANGEYHNLPSANEVTDVPQGFKDYIKANDERIQGWSSQPYYIKDNHQFYDKALHPEKYAVHSLVLDDDTTKKFSVLEMYGFNHQGSKKFNDALAAAKVAQLKGDLQAFEEAMATMEFTKKTNERIAALNAKKKAGIVEDENKAEKAYKKALKDGKEDIRLSDVYGTKYDEDESVAAQYIGDLIGSTSDAKRYHPEFVKLENVYSVQEDVFTSVLKKYIEHPEGGHTDAAVGELPKILRFGDKMYVFDGNHRVSAALIRGESGIKANIIDISPKSLSKLTNIIKNDLDQFMEIQMGESEFKIEFAKAKAQQKELTREEKIKAAAEKRHAARTPEKIQQLQEYAKKHKEESDALKLEIKQTIKASEGIQDVDKMVGALKDLLDSKYATAEKLRAAAAAIQAKVDEFNTEMDNAKALAKELDGISDVDTKSVLKARSIQEVKDEAKKLQDVKDKIAKLTELDNPLQAAKDYSLAEAVATHNSVVKTYKKWEASNVMTDELWAKKLSFEAYDYLGGNMNDVQNKYKTWKVSQAAYLKKLKEVNENIWVKESMQKAQEMYEYYKNHTKNYSLHTLWAKADDAIIAGDHDAFHKAYSDFCIKKQKIEGKNVITLKDVSDEECNALIAEFQANRTESADKYLRPLLKKAWAGLSEEHKRMLTKYTQAYEYLNRPLRNLEYTGWRSQKEAKEDLVTLTKALSQQKTKKDMVVRRGTRDYPIAELGIKSLGDLKPGQEFTDGAFLSTAVKSDGGFFDDYELIIVVPRGAEGTYAEPFSHYTGPGPNGDKYDYEGEIWDGKFDANIKAGNEEREWIGQRGSRFKVIKVNGTTVYLKMIGQMYDQPKSKV